MNQTEKLTPEQSLQLLSQIAYQVKLTIQEGDTIKQALQVIYELIENSKPQQETKQTLKVKDTK